MENISQNSDDVFILEIIAVAYQRSGELRVFTQSWINQTEKNWKLRVLHDGPNEEFCMIMEKYRLKYPDKISYQCTSKRYNDYGHSLREIGLNFASGDYILLTNADNYYVPQTLKFLNEATNTQTGKRPDVVMFDMIHSHENPGNIKSPSYSYFPVSYGRRRIDIGAAIVESSLAKKAGFSDKSFAADASYFENILATKVKMKEKLNLIKIPRVLFVHN